MLLAQVLSVTCQQLTVDTATCRVLPPQCVATLKAREHPCSILHADPHVTLMCLRPLKQCLLMYGLERSVDDAHSMMHDLAAFDTS